MDPQLTKPRSNQTDAYPHIPLALGYELLIEILELNLRIKNHLVGLEKGSFILTKISANDLLGIFRSESIKKSDIHLSYVYENEVY